jgi:LPXTG-motif cell wall-anchored protein
VLPGGVGGLLIFVGVVWLLQGIGVIGGSFMTGSSFWAVVGGACILSGGALLIFARSRRTKE